MLGSQGAGSCGVGFICNTWGARSREIVAWGIEAVKNLTHRGAVGADGKTGDGAGVLLQIPRKFFLRELAKSGYALSHGDNLAVGVFFLYRGLEPEIEALVTKHGLKVIGWRDVPHDDTAIGQSALQMKPRIRQLLIDTEGIEEFRKEVRLFLVRRAIERAFGSDISISSLSSKAVVYKGLLVATKLDTFYPDLKDNDVESSFCVFHQRFSTNTLPDWRMAQPFRVLAHNGEINTIQGNRNWLTSLEHEIYHEVFGTEEKLLRPLASSEESDSSSLDRILELFILAGFSLEHAINVCVPPAWECCDFATEGLRREAMSFFEYQSLLMRPWDGPAALVFTDGETVGAHLDRNGLRPLRYVITEDGVVLAGSEMGLVDFNGRRIRAKGRLGPGDTMVVDTTKGSLRFTGEILKELADQRPYKAWIVRLLYRVKGTPCDVQIVATDVMRRQAAFGYALEEIQTSIKEMAEKAGELTFSMGDDTPLPPLAEKPQLLFRYFKQRFSQVTNPSIDPIRERMVMSLRMDLGYERNFLIEVPEHAQRLQIDSPILTQSHMLDIEEQGIFTIVRIPTTFSRRNVDLAQALAALQETVAVAVRNGAAVIILTDNDVSRDRAAIPSLLAVSASFKHLQELRLANRASLIIETGEARDVHHMACLIGYGASAVYPYLAYQSIKKMCESGEVKLPFEKAAANYKVALEEGLLKVIARLGISTISSYHGAQLFDSLCLTRDFVEKYFSGTPLGVESDGLSHVEESLMKRHAFGFESPEPTLDYGGFLKHRRDGERHAWSPAAVLALNKFVKNGDYAFFKEFSRLSQEHPVYMRHLLTYRKGSRLPLQEVEPEERIMKRFVSGAMSVGALSPEAHEAIAEACNSLGIRSNSGEGGEDPLRYWGIKNSAIKQLASGRFGVTPAYIASASELEIKVAQGAKPGEGGHLPSVKVTEYIARLRHCKPNTLLISPPPHHDIYSIEDLAQLIHDLKQANPIARVCVKLVSETGVGTVAAGVAKAYADTVQISGYEGGTGAAPITSIKNVGNYWEIGLAETQRVLVENGLRQKIRVRVDGGLRTGKDIIIAALFGAEEFGFGTATMIAAGCVMARQCHLNTCPTGIATQDARLRAKFKGGVSGIRAYFSALAREVREILAEMGFRDIDEIIGRTDLLEMSEAGTAARGGRLNLRGLFDGYHGGSSVQRCTAERNDNPAPSMNDRLVKDLLPFIKRREQVRRKYGIRNIDRSVPVKLNYHISLLYKDEGLPPGTVELIFRGVAGQSFGAFTHRGVSLTLIGDANDYVGKGMYGGRIVIRPWGVQKNHEHVIMGNTVLYGATGGELFASGRAGERFGVRNSGATAVVEGTGQHLCEYMTGGTVVVLGEVGYNIGAGMTGGTLYLCDEHDRFKAKINSSYVKALCLEEGEIEGLKSLIEAHFRYTESPRAGQLLAEFQKAVRCFIKVVPV